MILHHLSYKEFQRFYLRPRPPTNRVNVVVFLQVRHHKCSNILRQSESLRWPCYWEDWVLHTRCHGSHLQTQQTRPRFRQHPYSASSWKGKEIDPQLNYLKCISRRGSRREFRVLTWTLFFIVEIVFVMVEEMQFYFVFNVSLCEKNLFPWLFWIFHSFFLHYIFFSNFFPFLFLQLAYFLRRQYEIISAFFVALYNKYAPIVQSSITDAYQWLEVAVPKAYHFTVTNLLLLKKTIYELNPAMFDKVYVILCDAFNYVVKMVPIVVERCMVALNVLLETLRSYFAQSQQWMQQQFKKWVTVISCEYKSLGV